MYDIAKTRDRKRSTPYNASAFYCGTHFDHSYQQYVNQSIEDIEVALVVEKFPDGGPDNHDQPTTDEAMRSKHREQWMQSMNEKNRKS